MNRLILLALGAVALLAASEILAFGRNILFRSERPPVGAVQHGFRGTGLVDVYNPRTREALREDNRIPESVPYSGDVGAKASTVYENVQVLGDVNAGEFTRLMVNMTEWVAPDQGCAACHNVENFAEDTLYTKVVARRMLQMVRHINSDWTAHVAKTGVTCYTCHRGKLVPPNVWFNNPGPQQAGGFAQSPRARTIRRRRSSATPRCRWTRSRRFWRTGTISVCRARPPCQRTTATPSSRRNGPIP